MKKEKRWNRHDVFPWGKHKGESLISVIVADVHYVTWCIENVAGFVLDNDTYEAYESFNEI